MAEEKVALTGVEKAAILLMTLGETAAAQVIKFLGPREVQKNRHGDGRAPECVARNG